MSTVRDAANRQQESAALRTARAFVSGDVEGVDPNVTGRDAYLAWLDMLCQCEEDWWFLLAQDALVIKRRPFQAREENGAS